MRGRKQTAPRQRWDKTIIAKGLPDVPNGIDVDVTPAPGRTYTRYTWPPRGRGRGESLTSPRRIAAKLRTIEVIRMRAEFAPGTRSPGLGFKDASGPYRAYKRAVDRMDWDSNERQRIAASEQG
jgi:hypothetical protein